MGGDNHQDSDSEYVDQYDDDFGQIRRSTRLRLRFMQNEQQRLSSFIDPSEEDEDDQQHRSGFGFRRSERLKDYNRREYINDSSNGVNHKYSLRRLRNRVNSNSNRNIYSYHHDNRQSDPDDNTRNNNSNFNSRSKDASCGPDTITSPRRLRARTKKISYKERRPNLQLDDDIDKALEISKPRKLPPSPQAYKNILSQNNRWNSLSYGVGSGGAGIFGNDYDEEDSIKPVMQYHQCIKQIKLLPKELQEKSKDILQMHLENKDFPELPVNLCKNVDFNDIIGHDEHVHTLREMLKISLIYPEFSVKGLDISKGVLFYGPPGTGKTMTARALASSCSTPDQPVSFFFCSCADVQSKWFGESEKHLKQLFDQARTSQPSIIFFDEIDGLTPTRSSSENAYYNTIVNTLLTLMDGLKGRGQVIVIAATNRLDTIDPAFLRPGRFDRILEFSLPDRDARLKMIRQYTKLFMVSENLIAEISRATQGCNGADVKFLCSAAIFRAIRRYYPNIVSSKKKIQVNLNKIKVKMEDFSKELVEMKNCSSAGHVVHTESGIELLLPDTWNAIYSFLNSNYNIISNKFNSHMHKRNNYYEPRILITGAPYSGQVQLGNNIKKWLIDKGFRVDTLAYPNMENIECVIQNLQYSKMRAILITNVETWSSNSNDPLRHLELCLSELYAVPVLVVGIESTYDSTSTEVSQFFECKTSLVEDLFHLRGAVNIRPPTADSRRNYFMLFFEELTKKISSFKRHENSVRKGKVEPQDPDEVNENPEPDSTINEADISPAFTESELRTLEQKFQEVMIELKQRLRGFHRSLSKKHRIFTQPFDSEKYPGYEKINLCSIDLNTILENVDSNCYFHPEEWMRDVDMIFQNALLYHTRVKRIQEVMHKAYEFRDYAGSLLNTIPSVSKLNYWQLKMWTTVKDKLFSQSGIIPDRFADNGDMSVFNSTKNDNSLGADRNRRRINDNDCENTLNRYSSPPMVKLSNGQTSLQYSEGLDCYSADEKYKGMCKRSNSETCIETDTPLVRHRRYKIPINNFSSDEEDVYKQNYENQHRQDECNNQQHDDNCKQNNNNYEDGNSYQLKYKQEYRDDDINFQTLRNGEHCEIQQSNNETSNLSIKKNSFDMITDNRDCATNNLHAEDDEVSICNSSDGEAYVVESEIKEKVSKMLDRVVLVSEKLPFNDTIVLSSILWNVIAIEEEDGDLIYKLFSSIDEILSKMEKLIESKHPTFP